MKRVVLVVLIASLFIMGCRKNPDGTGGSHIMMSGIISEHVVKGHTYLSWKSGYAGGFIHAAHCPCELAK